MSIEIMTWVWKYSETAGSERLVLLALADNANDEGYCWPSIATIARKCRMKRDYAKKILRQLEQNGHIGVQRRKIGRGMNKSNMYYIPTATGLGVYRPLTGVEETPMGVSIDTPHRGQETPMGVSIDTPEPSINHQENRQLKPSEREREGVLVLSLSLPVPAKKAAEDPDPVKALSAITGQKYDPALQVLIAQTLGNAPDLDRLKIAALSWKAHGYKAANLDGILEWYRKGIPGKSGRFGEPIRDATYYDLPEVEAEPDESDSSEDQAEAEPEPPPPPRPIDPKPHLDKRPESGLGMSPRQAWQAARGQLQMEMPKSAFDTWVRHAELTDFDPDTGVFTVRCPTEYAAQWLNSRLKSTIDRLLTGMSNRSAEVKFVAQELEPA